MSAIIVRLSDSAVERLTAMADNLGVDVDVVVERLLDRDPHDHDHRCPTCVRAAERAARQEEHAGQEALWA